MYFGFGIFLLIIIAIANLKKDVSDISAANKRKRKAQEEGKEFYFDRCGRKCHIDTDVPYELIREKDGHVWEVRTLTGDKVKDVTLERRKKAIEEARREGKKYGELQGKEDRWGVKMNGKRYINVNNEKIYVKRKFCGVILYMNIDTDLFEDYDPNSVEQGRNVMVCGDWSYVTKENVGEFIRKMNTSKLFRGNHFNEESVGV